MENDPIFQTLVLLRIGKTSVHDAFNKIKNEVSLERELIKFCEFMFTEVGYTTETNYTAREQVEIYLNLINTRASDSP